MKTRRQFTAEFKVTVALEEIQDSGRSRSWRHGMSCTRTTQWKRKAVEKLAKVFDDKGF